MKAPLKAVSFDAAGTLFSVAEPVGDTYSRIAEKRGIKVPAGSLRAAFRRAWTANADHGVTTPNAERQWWHRIVSQTFALACRDSSLPIPRIDDLLFEDLFSHYARGSAWKLYPETCSVLQHCSKTSPLAVISNFDHRLYRILEELKIGDYFDTVVISDPLGFRKPDPRIFLAAVDFFGIKPSQMLHVGDDPVCDWQGAAEAGCRTFHLDRPQITLVDVPSS